MTPDEAIPSIAAFWDIPDGVLYRLRQGEYDADGIDQLERTLGSIRVEAEVLPVRFVSLTWLIPTFMGWQTEQVQRRGGDVEALRRDITRIENTLNGVLGIP